MKSDSQIAPRRASRSRQQAIGEVSEQAVRDRDRPFNLVFLSGHHRCTHEMAIRCQEPGIQLSVPPEETRGILRHYVSKGLISWLGLEAYGVHYYESVSDLTRAVHENRVDAFIVSLPEHLDLVPEHFGPIPIAAEHMVNRYDDYRARASLAELPVSEPQRALR